MITIADRGNCFFLGDEVSVLAFCRYEKNRICPAECSCEVPKNLLFALYRAVLSKLEKQGYPEALCEQTSPELEVLGFKDGSLSLIDFFKSCE